jgi:hypothetical protein
MADTPCSMLGPNTREGEETAKQLQNKTKIRKKYRTALKNTILKT